MIFKKQLFTEIENKAIVQAIADAEDLTSGEIRVHIEAKCKGDPLERCKEVFFQLKMDKTAEANGVLIYLAYDDHKFAIVGDSGINHVVPANFWEGTKDVMSAHFSRKEFYQGLIFAISETGKHLKHYFPARREDINELPDEISHA